jgi:eukaryotic-like serine/threonine-protein kinase
VNQDLPPSELPQTIDEKDERAKSRDPLVGTVLDNRFQIEEVLGSGGMSVVYKATQLRVNRHVAIKTLRLQLDEKDIYRERFQREISSLCALNHPNIVTVYDCLIGPDGQPYIVMDYLRGRSLEALIEDEGPMDVERFARISIQICSAVDHAHKKGIIHRDLKPGNVVLMDNEMDFVKVVDFGLAKIGDQNRRLTHSGELWGSPPYMSPEQCMGEALDQRSDLYSIGAIMYEMLTGFDPYRNAATVFEFIKCHTSVPPPAMTTANALVRVPQKVEAVVFKALEKDPARRYQTAKELQDAIVEASSASVDREKGEFLFHLANQASTKVSSGPQPEPPQAAMTASKAFNLALNPLTDEMLLEGNAADREVTVTDFDTGTNTESFSPSVQRWRQPGTPSPPGSEIVHPTGEVVQPAGEVVPPPGVPLSAESTAAPTASFASSNPTIPAGGSVPSAPTSSLASARVGPPPAPSGPPKVSRPRPSADSPAAANPWLLVVLLALVAVAGLIYVLPGLTGHGSQQVQTAPPAAPSTGETPIQGASGPKVNSDANDQAVSAQSENDKTGKRGGPRSPDDLTTPKNRGRHTHLWARGQAAGKINRAAATNTQTGGAPARSATTTSTSRAKTPAAHSAGKADPWSTLENMR